MYYVYILKLSNNTHYAGSTDNLKVDYCIDLHIFGKICIDLLIYLCKIDSSQ